jgi:hypothetical protein
VRLTASEHAIVRRPGVRLMAQQLAIDFADVSSSAASRVPGSGRAAPQMAAHRPMPLPVVPEEDDGAHWADSSWAASALSPELRATADLFAPPPSESRDGAATPGTPLRSAASNPQPARADAFTLGVGRLEAHEDVTVELQDQGLVLMGEHLVADDAARQVQMFGHDAHPARAVAAGYVLTGHHLLLDEATRRLHVLGPGTLALQDLAMVEPGSADGAAGDRLRVAWQEAMHYDHDAGQATFAGDVRLGTSERGDHTELRCGHLALELVELPDATRSVRTATARGGAGGGGDDVVFVNQRLRRGGAEGHVASRLRLAGPVLTFDNALQQVQVLGPGSLLVEDYRPTARVPAASASDDDPAAMVARPRRDPGRDR